MIYRRRFQKSLLSEIEPVKLANAPIEVIRQQSVIKPLYLLRANGIQRKSQILLLRQQFILHDPIVGAKSHLGMLWNTWCPQFGTEAANRRRRRIDCDSAITL